MWVSLSKQSTDPLHRGPVKCLPRGMHSLFNWGEAYPSGVASEAGYISFGVKCFLKFADCEDVYAFFLSDTRSTLTERTLNSKILMMISSAGITYFTSGFIIDKLINS